MKSQMQSRAGERGAALITAVLLSMLLLAAGGILILTSTMTGITARDSTAEMQAYYAAEAGIAKTLEVLRGNVDSSPSGTRASFRNVVCSPALWPTTATWPNGGYVNVTSDSSTKFQVTSILDPDKQNSASWCTDPAFANYKPERLRIRVTGLGPRDSRKNMEVVVNRYTLEYDVKATVTLPNGSGNPISFNLGGSNVTSTSGVDVSGGGTISAVAISDADKQRVNNVIDGCDPDGSNCTGSGPNVTPGDPAILGNDNTPSFLKDVASAREFLYGSEGMKQAAINQGRYFTSGAAAIASDAGLGASNPDGVFTFVDGDLVLGPGSPTGQGTIIVTGKLTLNGNFQWNGVIMVLGTGEVYRSGGGHGDIFGAMFVAKFPTSGADSDKFGAPVFDTSGGGTSNIQYSSDAVDRAKSVGGHSVKGVREY
ncbi:MAG TPA: pilus assembly PilX N-terminal domain-containing protein [Pyrinomonadaceae bacterium]|nr:pilus assembly PilX N-terminal domain-containing protein [Pyrinomonadaceae bacterium]